MANYCGDCRHFYRDGTFKPKGVSGLCRRRAPAPISANLLKCLSIMAVGAMIEAQKTGLLEAAVMDLREGKVCDPAGRHTAAESGSLWPIVGKNDYCGDFESKRRKQSDAGV